MHQVSSGCKSAVDFKESSEVPWLAQVLLPDISRYNEGTKTAIVYPSSSFKQKYSAIQSFIALGFGTLATVTPVEVIAQPATQTMRTYPYQSLAVISHVWQKEVEGDCKHHSAQQLVSVRQLSQ